MMSTPLIISDHKIRELKRHADHNFINVEEMKQIVDGKAKPVGDRPGHECTLDFGFRVVYSIEEHPTKDGGTVWLRHMSMSLVKADRTPNEFALGSVGQLLGFPTVNNKLDYEKCSMWLEGQAVNAVCEVEKSDG